MATSTQSDEVSIQREYYRRTADHYDSSHMGDIGEHDVAIAFMMSQIDLLGIESLLDCGSGTGRVPLKVKQAHRNLKVVGIEPSAELREMGHAKGLSPDELIDGDAQNLAFADGSVDLVCEFAALHHIPDPTKTVSEMLRVARKAIFISDCNNYGQGGFVARTVKQILRAFGLWKAADFIQTRGKGYKISEGDGLFYSFSVFDYYPMISRQCRRVHLLNTAPAGSNLYRSAPHVALLGVK